MPLQATIEAAEFDALPDTTTLGKDSFVKNEKENKFFLNLPDAEASKLAFSLTDSVNKLTENNKNLLTQKGAVNDKLKPWEALGKTPEEIAELINSKRPEDVQKLVEAHNTEKETLKKSFEEPLNAAKLRADKFEQLHRENLAKSTISKLRADHSLDETAEFVLRDFIRVVPVEEGSDDYTIKVFDGGQPALVAGQPMTPDQLVTGFREAKRFQTMFLAGGGGGTGANPNQQNSGGGGKAMNRTSFEALSSEAQFKHIREGGTLTD